MAREASDPHANDYDRCGASAWTALRILVTLTCQYKGNSRAFFIAISRLLKKEMFQILYIYVEIYMNNMLKTS